MTEQSIAIEGGLLLESDKQRLKRPLSRYQLVTEVGSFRPQNVIDPQASTGFVDVQRLYRSARSDVERPSHFGRLEPQVVGSREIKSAELKKIRAWRRLLLNEQGFVVGQLLDTSPEAIRQTASVEIVPDVEQRLIGRTSLMRQICSLIKEEIDTFQTSARIRVRPAWSHEYENRSGIVIDVEANVDDDRRFLLWDAISTKVAALSNLSEADQSFVNDNISVFVSTPD
jgi:hypothetical protein